MESVEQPITNLPAEKLEIDTRVFAGLSYLFCLFIVPWIAKRDNKFVMFHVRQGVVLFIAELVAIVILWLLGNFLNAIFSFGALTLVKRLGQLVWLLFVAVSVVGVYFAMLGQEKQLPWLSVFAKNLKL
jgi:uncharacterized membrane protein